jgi:hypothetical protein
MKRLIITGIMNFLVIISSVFVAFYFLGKTSKELAQFVPNIVTMILQTVVLGLIISYIGLINSYKKKKAFFNSIQAILVEPLKRFNEPNISPVDLDNDNFGNTINLAINNIGNVELDNYHELINILYLQRNAINGLLSIAIQISEVHAWIIYGLICMHTKLIDEIEKIYRNNKIVHYNQIKDKMLFNEGFNGVFKIYLSDCKQFINTEKRIKP